MKTRLLILTIVSLLTAGLATAYAHHSLSATYDSKKEVKLEGKLILFLFRNPHVFVHMDVPDADGQMRRWAIEWGGTAQLSTVGITPSTFKTGDQLIITGNPSRSAGEHRAKMNTIRRISDGFGWGTRPGEVVD